MKFYQAFCVSIYPQEGSDVQSYIRRWPAMIHVFGATATLCFCNGQYRSMTRQDQGIALEVLNPALVAFFLE